MSRSPQSGKPIVVVVEDDAGLRAAMTFSFEIEGYAVRAYRDGGGALAAPGAEQAACLVLDERLPDASGLHVLSQLRARGIEGPALLVTSRPSLHLRAQAARAGVEIIEKPLLGDVLAAKVRDIVAARAVNN